MRIRELGMWPRLREGLPATIDAKLDMAMLRKIDKELKLKKKVKRRKKQLAKVIKKIHDDC